MIRNRLLLVTTLICLLLLNGCNNGTEGGSAKTKLSPDMKASAEKTLTALREFDLACGQNKPPKECKDRLIKMRAETEQFLTKVPEGELKTEITLALEAYVTRMRVVDEIKFFTAALEFVDSVLGGNATKNEPPEFVVNRDSKEDADFVELLKKKYAKKYRDGRGFAANAKRGTMPDVPNTTFDGTEVLTSTLKAGREHIERASGLLKE